VRKKLLSYLSAALLALVPWMQVCDWPGISWVEESGSECLVRLPLVAMGCQHLVGI
jgi:hypothetical protein